MAATTSESPQPLCLRLMAHLGVHFRRGPLRKSSRSHPPAHPAVLGYMGLLGIFITLILPALLQLKSSRVFRQRCAHATVARAPNRAGGVIGRYPRTPTPPPSAETQLSWCSCLHLSPCLSPRRWQQSTRRSHPPFEQFQKIIQPAPSDGCPLGPNIKLMRMPPSCRCFAFQ